jgi:hypothetical protein
MTRKKTSMGRLEAKPHSIDMIVNSSTDATKVRTSPKRRAIQPVSGTAMALDTP